MKRVLRSFAFIIWAATILLVCPNSLKAQAWTNLGLHGGQIYDIAIDPSNPNKMFASTGS